MDRNHEVAMTYTDCLNMVERFKIKQQQRVEGDWYLVERMMAIACLRMTEKEAATYREGGWTVTPVAIYKTVEIENK